MPVPRWLYFWVHCNVHRLKRSIALTSSLSLSAAFPSVGVAGALVQKLPLVRSTVLSNENSPFKQTDLISGFVSWPCNRVDLRASDPICIKIWISARDAWGRVGLGKIGKKKYRLELSGCLSYRQTNLYLRLGVRFHIALINHERARSRKCCNQEQGRERENELNQKRRKGPRDLFAPKDWRQRRRKTWFVSFFPH